MPEMPSDEETLHFTKVPSEQGVILVGKSTKKQKKNIHSVFNGAPFYKLAQRPPNFTNFEEKSIYSDRYHIISSF